IKAAPAWLALDEPTNHLDLAGTTALEEALASFGGAIVLVSLDRALLDDLCTRILDVGTDGPGTARGVRDFPGNFSAWRARRGEQAAAAEEQRLAARPAKSKAPTAKPASAKSTASAPAGEASKKAKNPWKLEQLETRIMKLEEEQARLHAEVARPEGVAGGGKVRR